MRKSPQSNVVQLVGDILSQAVRSGASDIHFEPTGNELLVKYRLDGTLKLIERLPKARGPLSMRP